MEADPRWRWSLTRMTELDAIAAFHAEMPRQGPGEAADVLWALDMVGRDGLHRVADAGCGPGADLEVLARELPQAEVIGIELMDHLAEEARARVQAIPNARVETASMESLDGPLDLIWCAGALYFLGVTEGLAKWRAALAPHGSVVFSEPVLLDGRRDVAERFWKDYPAITDLAGIEARVEAAGYTLDASRMIVGSGWRDYMAAVSDRISAMPEHPDPGLAAVIDTNAREVALWRQAPDEIAYALVIARPNA
jgi:SAM-dependent methyltransferase